MTKEFSWDALIVEASKQIPQQQVQAWITPVKFQELSLSHLIVLAPTPFHRDWILDHYKDIFETAVKDLYGLHIELSVELQLATQNSQQEETKDEQLAIPLTLNPIKTTPEPESTPPDGVPEEKAPLSPSLSQDFSSLRNIGAPIEIRHTFETFVVGASNQFAHAAARAVAEHPASQYNPLFLYSGAGLGKTHLLHAIANYFLRVNPKMRVCYISAERFVNDVIESIRHEKMSQFRQKYRDGSDILLMDDIQFLASKDRSQEEFFHTFNALHSSKRQIVVTSDKSPKDILGLEERLRTRFQWGLIADIAPPEIETRIAILRAKAEQDDIFLPNDVALFLASNIRTNIRELEGALLRLGALADLSGVEISLDLAKQNLGGLIKNAVTTLSPDVIQDAVAAHFGISVSDLKGKDRSRKIVLPRQISMYLLRKYTEKSYLDIGVLLGGKDHSTVMHGINHVASQLGKDPDIKKHVESIQNSL